MKSDLQWWVGAGRDAGFYQSTENASAHKSALYLRDEPPRLSIQATILEGGL